MSEQMNLFKQKWIGQKVEIIDNKHPHYKRNGEVSDIKYTAIGYGMEITFPEGDGCFVFNGNQIKVL